MAAGTIGVLLELAGVTSTVVSVLVLVFIGVAPTAAIAGLLRGFDRFARIILAAVTAAALIALLAMAMLAAGAWSPKGGLAAIAVLSAGCLLAQRVPAGTLRSLPGIRRFPGALISRWAAQLASRPRDWLAARAGGRPGACAERPDAARTAPVAEQRDGDCASPGNPAQPGPGNPAQPGPGKPGPGAPRPSRRSSATRDRA